MIPAGAPAPSQGHEAYLACGAPYYVQAISQSGTLLFPGTQFQTAEYPIGVDTFSNGDVAGLKDAGAGDKAFVFDSGGTKKSSIYIAHINSRFTYMGNYELIVCCSERTS